MRSLRRVPVKSPLHNYSIIRTDPFQAVGHIDGLYRAGEGPLSKTEFRFETLKHCAKCRHKLFCGGPCPLQISEGIVRTELCDDGFAVLLKGYLAELVNKPISKS